MLIDPISGMRLLRAKAAGGVFWYCKYSRGRMLTVATSRHFFGEDGTREIWMRSGIQGCPTSEYNCPSCTKSMLTVTKPNWIDSGGEIDVCRRCHVIWVYPDTHQEIPHPEDLLTPEGDSTLARDLGDSVVELEKQNQRIEDNKTNLFGEGPERLRRKIFAFLGLPVEMSEHGYPSFAFLTGSLIFVCMAVFWKWEGVDFASAWGFLPSDPMRNFGLTIFTGSLLHGGVFHLVFNLYFINMFGDDVEFDLGLTKFSFFLIAAAFTQALVMVLITQGNARMIPHIGASGIVMALMAYYTLQFPKSRLAYLFPTLHFIPLGAGATGFVRGLRWIRVPVWVVFFLYLLKDFMFYKLYGGQGGVSYSGHIGGAIAGGILWVFLSNKASSDHDFDITGERDITPGSALSFQPKSSIDRRRKQ